MLCDYKLAVNVFSLTFDLCLLRYMAPNSSMIMRRTRIDATMNDIKNINNKVFVLKKICYKKSLCVEKEIKRVFAFTCMLKIFAFNCWIKSIRTIINLVLPVFNDTKVRGQIRLSMDSIVFLSLLKYILNKLLFELKY